MVISARDAEAIIADAVGAARAQVGAEGDLDPEVVVVDNASSDATGERAAEAGAKVVRLDDRSAGPGTGRNAGVDAASGAVIAFTDADCQPTSGWIAALLEAMEGADLVTGPVLPDPRIPRSHWARTIAVTGPSPLYPTANLAVRRDEFIRAGGFEDWVTGEGGGEAPSHPYGEDTVLAWKLRRAGARPGFAPGAIVFHAVLEEGPGDWISRHGELGYLPELIRRVPELRGEMLVGGLFVSRRSAATSLAAAAAALALVTRSRRPLIAALPAAASALRRTAQIGPRSAAVWTAADLYSAWSLARGSVRSRTPVL